MDEKNRKEKKRKEKNYDLSINKTIISLHVNKHLIYHNTCRCAMFVHSKWQCKNIGTVLQFNREITATEETLLPLKFEIPVFIFKAMELRNRYVMIPAKLIFHIYKMMPKGDQPCIRRDQASEVS